jgi:leucyl/phenylalanyl-tRNA--protein transferase
MHRRPALLPPNPEAPFPPAAQALRVPDGLLAVGGDLSPARLLNAYRHGIFPWFSEGQPILWWTPDPRMVFRTGKPILSTRFRRSLRNCAWQVRADTAFDQVIAACASLPRPGQDGTWITPGMLAAYRELHRLGHAHSVEVFDGDRLVGGIYGVAIGRMFFGESMFSAEPGGSKVALAALARRLREWGGH